MEPILFVDGALRRPTVAALRNSVTATDGAVIDAFQTCLAASYSPSHVRSILREALKFAVSVEAKGRGVTGADVRDVVGYLRLRDGVPVVLNQRAGYLRVFLAHLERECGAPPALAMAADGYRCGETLFLDEAPPGVREAWRAVQEARDPDSAIGAEAFRSKAADFLDGLRGLRYSGTRIRTAARTLRRLYLFLVANGAAYDPVSARFWADATRGHGGGREDASVLAKFGDFLDKGAVDPRFRIERGDRKGGDLPGWYARELDGFLAELEREGHSRSSVGMHRVSCVRFGEHLLASGVAGFREVTPAIVMSFHVADEHATVAGKNAYGSRVRAFLDRLAESGVARPGLSAAIPGSLAVRRTVVTTLSPGDLDRVEAFRRRAQTPMELRDSAMVMLGLWTGLRAIDIVGLRLGDVDWASRTVTTLQSKTSRSVTVPLAVPVANSLYLYLTRGRPAQASTDHVFVTHRSPYGGIGRCACGAALARVLGRDSASCGFHVTRRTLASRMLASSVPVDVIADVLGHAGTGTVSRYLSRNEAAMRDCALPLSSVPLPEGGLLS